MLFDLTPNKLIFQIFKDLSFAQKGLSKADFDYHGSNNGSKLKNKFVRRVSR